MASTISDIDQQKLLQNFTASSYQAVDVSPHDEEALSASGESTDTAIWISDDDTDTEGEEDGESQDIGNSQSCCTTPTNTSIADHSDSTGPKHRPTESNPAIGMDTTPAVSPARVAGVPIWAPESYMDRLDELELNQQAPCQTDHMSAGDTTACTDGPFDVSATTSGSQPCLDVSDEPQFVAEATGAASEPGIMITDALAEEGSCHVSQSNPASPSIRTNRPVAATPENMAQTLLHDDELCASTSPDDAIPGARTSSPEVRLSPESRQEQGFGHTSCPPIDTEAESSEAESGSLLGVRVSPQPQELLSRRSRRRSPHTHAAVQDKDSGADAESSGSEDGLDVPGCACDEDYCPSSPKPEGYSSGEESDDDEQHGRKRRRVSRAPHTSVRSILASTWRSSQRQSTRRTAHSPEARRISACDTEGPAPSQATSVPAEARTILARFEEWPLQDASLKRITEGGRTTFQLQFEWTPDPSQPHADRSVPDHKKGRGSPKASLSATRSSGDKWTPEEENKVRTMRQNGCSWAEIHRTLPHRSQGTIQVRYSTKLKYLPNSE